MTTTSLFGKSKKLAFLAFILIVAFASTISSDSYLWGAVITLVTLMLSGILYQFISSYQDKKHHPPPGKLYSVGGHKLHLDCRGKNNGQPTIILEAGGGQFSATWGLVQDELAKHTRVCSYDRANFGWSESSNARPYPAKVVHELHTLLQAANIPPPYLMVGHSLGGVYVQVFAHTYPNEVQGLALIDTPHEKLFKLLLERFPKQTKLNTSTRLMLVIARWLTPFGIPRLLAGKSLQQIHPKLRKTYAGVSLTSRNLRSVLKIATTDIVQSYFDEAEAINKSLGDLPLLVMTANKLVTQPKFNAQYQKEAMDLNTNLQHELSERSTNSRHIIVDDSGHFIHNDQPELFIKEILSMLNNMKTDPV